MPAVPDGGSTVIMPADEKGRNGQERLRLLEVYRGWNRGKYRGLVAGAFRHGTLKTVVDNFLALFILFLLPLDEALWSFTGPIPWRFLAPESAGLVIAVFLTVFTARLFVFCKIFTWRRGHSPAFQKWVVAICTLASGLLLLHLIILVWRWLEARRPRWALRQERKNEQLSLYRSGGRLRRFLGQAPNPEISPTTFIALYLGSLSSFLVFVLWLARRAEQGPTEYRIAMAISVALHLVAFAMALVSLWAPEVRRQISRPKYFVLAACSLTLLAPIPYLPLVGAGVATLAFSAKRSETLAWSAWAQNTEPERLPLWWKLESSLRKEWRKIPLLKRIWSPPSSVTRQPRISDSEAQVIKLYNLEALSLALDAACLVWGLFWLAESRRSWAPVLGPLYLGLFWGSLLLACAAFLLVASHRFLMQLRITGPLRLFDRQPYPIYLLRTQFALMAGVYFGAAYRQGDALEIGRILAPLCGLLTVVQGMGIMLKPRKMKARWESSPSRNSLPIYAGFLVLAVWGALGESIKPLLVLWLISYPVRVALLGRRFLPWLLRPFSWRSMADRALPGRLRTRLAILTLSATLPLGGLAIPLCIYIRDRHWTEALAVWAQSNSNDVLIRNNPPKSPLANLQFERLF